MRLVFAGTPTVALPSLEALLDSHHEVVGVVTRPDAPAGRGRRLTPSHVAAFAQERGLEVLKPARPSDPEFQAQLRDLAPDACPVVAYGALLPASALEIPRHGWINLHFSLLPRWRGAAPVQRAIMAGDAETGTTVFRIVRELDAGDIYATERVALPEVTAGELLDQLARSGARQLLSVLDAVEAGAQPQPQPDEGVTLAPKITVDEARLDWNRDAVSLRNLVLACSPDPGAWCEAPGGRLKIYRAALADGVTAAPGQVVVSRRAVHVGTAQGAVELLEVQPAGKRRMAAIDWGRGQGIDGAVLT